MLLLNYNKHFTIKNQTTLKTKISLWENHRILWLQSFRKYLSVKPYTKSIDWFLYDEFLLKGISE